jgi:hypothetical protein
VKVRNIVCEKWLGVGHDSRATEKNGAPCAPCTVVLVPGTSTVLFKIKQLFGIFLFLIFLYDFQNLFLILAYLYLENLSNSSLVTILTKKMRADIQYK